MAGPSNYLSRMLSRLNEDIDFLVAHDHLSNQDAALIKSKLATVGTAPSPSLPNIGSLNVTDSPSSPPFGISPGGPNQRTGPPPPPRPSQPMRKARALWNYQGGAHDDLPFKKGDM